MGRKESIQTNKQNSIISVDNLVSYHQVGIPVTKGFIKFEEKKSMVNFLKFRTLVSSLKALNKQC